MSRIGVNTADSNAGRIKSGDKGSLITLTLDNIEGETVDVVEWVRAYDTKDITRYIDIPDYSVQDNQIFMTMPEMPRGEFNIEIKDEQGRIYPAEGTLKLSVLASTKDSIDVYYVTYKDLILEEVEPMVERYIIANPGGFKGEKGEKGEQGIQGEKGEQGNDGSVIFEELTQDQLDLLTPKVSFTLDDNGDLYYEINGGYTNG